MKTALIVGGDHVAGLKQLLASSGIEQVAHWSGRKSGDINQVIPRGTTLVVILIDWISHTLADKVKRSAHKLGLQIIYAKGNGGNLRRPLIMTGFAR
jgi:hypothetical protein